MVTAGGEETVPRQVTIATGSVPSAMAVRQGLAPVGTLATMLSVVRSTMKTLFEWNLVMQAFFSLGVMAMSKTKSPNGRLLITALVEVSTVTRDWANVFRM